MRSNERWIAAAMAMGIAVTGAVKVEAGDGLFGKKATGWDKTGHKHTQAPHDHVQQVSAEMAEIPEGTVISVTPIYTPGEEPGKASFDGTRGDARPAHGVGGTSVSGEPAPIGVVRTNYNNSGANPAARMPAPVDVMAHGKSAGGQQGMMPPGMMPPGMMPPGQAPGMQMKAPRRGLFGRLLPGRPSANDPYAVFNMSKSQRSAHAAIPMGAHLQGPVSSLPASAVYGGQGGAGAHPSH